MQKIMMLVHPFWSTETRNDEVVQLWADKINESVATVIITPEYDPKYRDVVVDKLLATMPRWFTKSHRARLFEDEYMKREGVTGADNITNDVVYAKFLIGMLFDHVAPKQFKRSRGYSLTMNYVTRAKSKKRAGNRLRQMRKQRQALKDVVTHFDSDHSKGCSRIMANDICPNQKEWLDKLLSKITARVTVIPGQPLGPQTMQALVALRDQLVSVDDKTELDFLVFGEYRNQCVASVLDTFKEYGIDAKAIDELCTAHFQPFPDQEMPDPNVAYIGVKNGNQKQ